MKGIIDVAVRLIRAGRKIYARKWSFLGLFAVAFIGSVLVLGAFDLLPEKSSTSPVVVTASRPNVTNNSAPIIAIPELPMKIDISAIGLSAAITNPTTTNVETLDGELLKGAVRYPTSAKLGENGNVVLFGHSSYLPIVNNQAYKTFNGIQKLSVGDVITVSSDTTAFTYRVRSVAKESADNNSAIPLSVAGKALTLVTCNSFGAKEDRFVVTADFVESHPAGS